MFLKDKRSFSNKVKNIMLLNNKTEQRSHVKSEQNISQITTCLPAVNKWAKQQYLMKRIKVI